MDKLKINIGSLKCKACNRELGLFEEELCEECRSASNNIYEDNLSDEDIDIIFEEYYGDIYESV